MKDLHETILERIEPDAGEHTAMADKVQRLLAHVQASADAAGIEGQATVQGSIAKDTWLRGAADVDLFFLVPPGTPPESLDGLAGDLAESVLEHPQRKYAQHPYIVGRFEGLEVDLVPAYQVSSAHAKMSAVDRTPFHTEWVDATLSDGQKQQVRLAKQWLKGIGAYGAQTDKGGFSGYLVEVLIAATSDFHGMLEWLAQATPNRIRLGDDEVTEPAPLVVVDPVDANRNVAAAVTTETLQLAQEAARAYLASPEDAFFFPAPAEAAAAESLAASLQRQGLAWVGIEMEAETDRLDIVYPQFQKTARQWAAAMDRDGFQVARHDTWTQDQSVCMQWLVTAPNLPRMVVHKGPPARSTDHADRFRAKWLNHPERDGDIETGDDGRLVVQIRPADQTPTDAVRTLSQRNDLGKHVQAALRNCTIRDDPALVLSPWAPHVTDFIFDRRPWQR